MSQHHFVVWYDTKTKQWTIDPADDAYFPDGSVWDGEKWLVPIDGEEAEVNGEAYSILLDILDAYNWEVGNAAHL